VTLTKDVYIEIKVKVTKQLKKQ